MTEPPHLLVVPTDGDPTLTCPHDPPTLDMPCAVLLPCIDCDDLSGSALCAESPTASHGWLADQLVHPAAECWAVHHADLEDALEGTSFPPGTHLVWPVSEDDGRMYLAATAPTTKVEVA